MTGATIMLRAASLSAALAGALLGGGRLAAQTVAITGGTVYPVSGPKIENGTVLIRDGKIVAVGANVTVPAGAERVDAAGKWVTPGLVNAATQLGVVEIGAVAETRDVAARGQDAVAAAFKVSDGLNPASVLIVPARNEGVTSVVIVPQGGLIAGQAAFVDLVDGPASNMIRRDGVAMVGQIGSSRQASVGARGELIARLREIFTDVRAYQRNKASFERGDSRELAASRADLEALVPVVDGRVPLLVAVDRAADIDATLDLAREFGLKIIIGGGSEAWEVADRLAAAKVPVLTGAMNNIPGSFASLGNRQEGPGLLRKAGVQVAIIGNAGGGDEEAFNVRNIKYEAGNAVSYGMSWDDALRAITLTPAEIFGMADRVGSLAPGKDANVVVWSGDPFELLTRVEAVYLRGRRVQSPSRQDMLMRRYKTLPPAYEGQP
jgi:imidazolonepropionase-like amidohydrolase